ncbi:helix-turn-helix domain-containing protein [Tenacibaculum sp. FZY0031]|uniref:winged helix-turn-helix transcriptional regulator n=1 Tax=Tenacibaculum sp. FZY0031 TaxID=3116648 RepID=UPI002ECD717E|nr:helix-turn-helix domain-containing protein [Tenacibaculum sp. FZY0031]
MKNFLPDYCPLTYATKVISGKWKLFIISRLVEKPLRYGQIKTACETISEKMLTSQLKELEADGIIVRKIYAEVPPRVEYSLTPFGNDLVNALAPLHAWGIDYMEHKKIPFPEHS